MNKRLQRVVIVAVALWAGLGQLAFAVRPQSVEQRDIQRFGLQSLYPVQKPASRVALRAFSAFNQNGNSQWHARFDPRTGALSALTGGHVASVAGGPRQAAFAFLSANAAMLGVNANSLILEKQISVAGVTHLLFSQVYGGIPVEFARVKIDIDSNGSVTGYHSSYESALNLNAAPAVQESQAAQAAVADGGAQAQAESGTLVIWPNRQTSTDNLAWRIIVHTPSAIWRYYIDAQTGAVLFRYQDEQSVGESGLVNGLVYAVDPTTTPAALQPFPYERVCVKSSANCVTTTANGTYSSAVSGEIFTTLQGLYVGVSNFQGPNANYANEGSSWQVVSTALSSVHPYTPFSVSFATLSVSAAAPSAVEFLPIFSTLNIGITSTSGLGGGGEAVGILQDDQLTAFDSFGNPVADYIGSYSSGFKGTSGIGQSMVLELDAAGGGSGGYGYDVATSSCLVLSNPSVSGSDNVTWWPSSYTLNGMHSEISLYYQLNQMHDYFANTISSLSVSGVALKPAVALSLVDNLTDAFYDPEHDNMFYGNVLDALPSDSFADDATVPRHEYTHFLTQKIWDIQNFGQAGAISEGNADYNSASSLGDPNIAAYVLSQLGYGYVPLRELDDNATQWTSCPGAASCVSCSEGPHCDVLSSAGSGSSNDWTGEIHTDSVFFSQALWDIRRNLLSASAASGVACANEMEFDALLSYPESFTEFQDALDAAAKNYAALPACAAISGITANQIQGYVDNAFTAHGLASILNGGFETALDVSTTPSVQASINTSGQINFYTFGAGPGRIQITMTLPASPDGQGYYSAYGMTLFDQNHNVLVDAQPALNGVGTGFAGGTQVCSSQDCTTTQQQVALSYANSSAGHFYLRVAGSPTGSDSNSGVNNSKPYILSISYNPVGALTSQVINASFDHDVISFDVGTPDLTQGAATYNFAYAQLRDQGQNVMAQTQTNQVPTYLAVVSTTNASGSMSGQLQIQPGFSSRYPAVGSVYVEIFGADSLGDSVSFGLSNAVNLGANASSLQAWNNVFNPLQGQQTTVKYQLQSAGQVSLKIYTLSGMLVDTLLNQYEPAGQGSINWNGQNMRGTTVASGVYLVHINAPGISDTQKIVVVK